MLKLLKFVAPLAAAWLVACSSTPVEPIVENAGAVKGNLGMEQFGRMPLPNGSKLRAPDSMIFGAGDNWLGRAVFELPGDANSNYAFFADQFPRQGWSLVTSIRGKKSLQVFSRSDRSTTVEIEEGFLFGSTLATITVSPTGSGSLLNPSMGAPSGNNGVTVRPIGGAGSARP